MSLMFIAPLVCKSFNTLTRAGEENAFSTSIPSSGSTIRKLRLIRQSFRELDHHAVYINNFDAVKPAGLPIFSLCPRSLPNNEKW